MIFIDGISTYPENLVEGTRYRIVTWPESQEFMEDEDSLFLPEEPNMTYAVPDEDGDYVLYLWPNSQDKDGYHFENNTLSYEPK